MEARHLTARGDQDLDLTDQDQLMEYLRQALAGGQPAQDAEARKQDLADSTIQQIRATLQPDLTALQQQPLTEDELAVLSPRR